MAIMDNSRIRSQRKVLWSPTLEGCYGSTVLRGYLGTFQGSLKGLTGKQICQLLPRSLLCTEYRSILLAPRAVPTFL